MDKIGMIPVMKIGMIPVLNLLLGKTLGKVKADLKIAVLTDNGATNNNLLAATTILILKHPKGTTLKGSQGQMIQTIVAEETMEEETAVVEETTRGVRTLIHGHHSHLESHKIGQSPIIQMFRQL